MSDVAVTAAASGATTESTGAAILEVRAVTKRFAGLTAVDAVDLDVRRGEIRGVVGPNGAGKTTLFNLISGLYAVSSGSVLLNGDDVTAHPPHVRAAAGLGRTYQTPQIFPDLSLFDNIAVGLSARRPPSLWRVLRDRRRDRFAAVADIETLLDTVELPRDLHMLAGALSFGHQKRLEIARALAGTPRVLLLDEPAAGLNRAEIDSLMTLVRGIRDRGVTVCLIEHNMRLVMGVCDRITVLDFGRTIAEGTPDAVRRDPLVIKAYLGVSRAGV